jgi:drug/metabolite transporter (DMT)-like permease
MKTKPFAILLVLIATIFTSLAQVFWKFGADRLALDFRAVLLNYHIWIGFGLYGIAGLLLVYALKNGELSVLYPIVATSYVWVSLMAVKFFNDELNPWKWAGILVILLGVSLIGYGSQKSHHSPHSPYTHKDHQSPHSQSSQEVLDD